MTESRRYRIDPAQSTVWIEARSSLHPINSTSTGLEGFFEAEVGDGPQINLGAPMAGHVELPLGRLSSGNPLYDREMRRRSDAGRHPAILGDLTEMEETGPPGTYMVRGDVNFRGVRCPCEDRMRLSGSTTEVRLEGEHVFDIRDFGMEPPKIMMLRVHPDVRVRIRIVAIAEE